MPFKTAKQDETLKKLVPRRWEIFVCWLEPNPVKPYSDLIVNSGGSYWRIDPSGELFEIGREIYQRKWSEAFRYEIERR